MAPSLRRHITNDFVLNRVSKYIRSEAGRNVQEELWKETMDELKKLTTLPREFE
jgi:hypothetical protein